MDVGRPITEWLHLEDEISRCDRVRKCAIVLCGLWGWGYMKNARDLSDPNRLHNKIDSLYITPSCICPFLYFLCLKSVCPCWHPPHGAESWGGCAASWRIHRRWRTKNKPNVSLSYGRCEKPAGITGTETITQPSSLCNKSVTKTKGRKLFVVIVRTQDGQGSSCLNRTMFFFSLALGMPHYESVRTWHQRSVI